MAQVSWTRAGDGSWTDDTAWSVGVAPVSSDDVTIAAAASGLLTVSGPGASDNLSLLGPIGLSGTFATGGFNVGNAIAPGGVQLAAGSTLTARSAFVAAGTLDLAGSSLDVPGALTVGNTQSSGFGDTVSVGPGSNARVGSLVLVPGQAFVSVAQGSTFEVGSAGAASNGSLTVDNGSVVSGAGTLSAPSIVDNGTIVAQGGTLVIDGPVTGSGALQIGTGATLALATGMSSTGVEFTDATGALQIAEAANGAILTGGPIAGFIAGDVLRISGASAVTTVSYAAQSASTGTLTLMDGPTAIGSLTLQGSFGSSLFQVAADSQQGYDVTVVTEPDPLFDPTYYLAHNPDVARAGVDPYQHYLAFGFHEGRNPDAYFDSNYYLTVNPDVKAAGVNPLQHFEAAGWKEGRDPSLVFGDASYLAANPDVAAAGIDPLEHFLQYGHFEGRTASPVGGLGVVDPLVDPTFYDAQLGATLVPAGAAGAQQAQYGYDNGGWQNGLSPDAFFDTAYYLASNPDVAAAHIDPLLHYETFGWHEGRDPSGSFSTNQYLSAYGDVAAAGVNPLAHFVEYGQAEGRTAFHV